MFQRRPRRFRRRSNDRNRSLRDNGDMHVRLGSNPFSNGQIKNNFRTTQSAEKLFEKYNILAKEALSSGDKILSENYFQHADHFMRIIGDKNRNQNQSRVQVNDKPVVDDKHLSKNNDVNQENTVKEKKE
jgi:hypothetical protein